VVVFRKLTALTALIMEKTLAYETPYLAKLVHSFPRFDLSLHRVNATFLLDSHSYKEVLSLNSHVQRCVERLCRRNRKYVVVLHSAVDQKHERVRPSVLCVFDAHVKSPHC